MTSSNFLDILDHAPIKKAARGGLVEGVREAQDCCRLLIISTVKAGSINLTQWKVGDDDAALADVLQRFAWWQAVRASLQFLTFAVTIWALAVNSPTG